MKSLAVLVALILTAVLLLVLQSSFGSAGDSPSGQHAVEDWDWIASYCAMAASGDGKPPPQAVLRPAESEAEEEIGRQIAQLVLEAQEEGRTLDEEELRPLFEQLMPDRVVILGAEEGARCP